MKFAKILEGGFLCFEWCWRDSVAAGSIMHATLFSCGLRGAANLARWHAGLIAARVRPVGLWQDPSGL